ncbi:MAG: hypothetical protein KIT09_10555 [Bryobacteraceae bacterium]|nr:hypothetical protein [Bryobacteraceae bacterium]
MEWSLWLVMVVAQIALIARLAHTGLWRTYRFFAAYVAGQLLQSAALMSIPPGITLYGIVYAAFEGIIGLCAVMAILEIYHLVLQRYPGIGTLGRRALKWGSVLALGIAAATLYPDIANQAEKYPTLLAVFVFQRALYSALLLFVMFIAAFLVWFPIPLTRNTALHAGVFGLSFATASLILLVRNALGGEYREMASTIQLGVYAACLVAWILFLTPAGERSQVVVGHRWAPEAEARLVEQLNEINRTLVRSTRK